MAPPSMSSKISAVVVVVAVAVVVAVEVVAVEVRVDVVAVVVFSSGPHPQGESQYTTWLSYDGHLPRTFPELGRSGHSTARSLPYAPSSARYPASTKSSKDHSRYHLGRASASSRRKFQRKEPTTPLVVLKSDHWLSKNICGKPFWPQPPKPVAKENSPTTRGSPSEDTGSRMWRSRQHVLQVSTSADQGSALSPNEWYMCASYTTAAKFSGSCLRRSASHAAVPEWGESMKLSRSM
mmetsp:Transcript_7037/g.19991  ORF Transcript_7037/g.19991 Transcript_7037/m.19991 type:complete len:237 (+) Transcript_7037:175-885(+)